MKRRHEPDVLFVEPSEMVVNAEMRHVCAMGRRDTDFEEGPFITLLNGPHFDFLWAERMALINGQVRGADAVAIGRADAVDAEMRGMIRAALKELGVDPFPLSSTNEEGVDRLMALIS